MSLPLRRPRPPRFRKVSESARDASPSPFCDLALRERTDAAICLPRCAALPRKSAHPKKAPSVLISVRKILIDGSKQPRARAHAQRQNEREQRWTLGKSRNFLKTRKTFRLRGKKNSCARSRRKVFQLREKHYLSSGNSETIDPPPSPPPVDCYATWKLWSRPISKGECYTFWFDR